MMKVNDMKIISMKLTTMNGAWSVVVADANGYNKQALIMTRRPGESLADAAVRLEDTMRQLQEGTIKPLDVAL